MSQEPTHVSRDQSIMVVGTAHIQGRDHDGINDLNAFSVAAAVGMLARVSLDRRVVLLAATREPRVAEIMELMEPGDVTLVVTHMDPELFERVAPFLSEQRARALRSAVEAEHAIRRFVSEHRETVGAPDGSAVLEMVGNGGGFSLRHQNGTVYAGDDGSVGFLDAELQAAYEFFHPSGLPVGLPTTVTSYSGRVGTYAEFEFSVLYASELGRFGLSRPYHSYYLKHGGASVFGLPTDLERNGWADFERGTITGTDAPSFHVTGEIYERYKLDRAALRLPIGPESDVRGHLGGGGAQHFDHGAVYETSHGTFLVADPIRWCLLAHGDVGGELGFPVREAIVFPNGVVIQDFEDGTIITHALGTFAVPSVIDGLAGGLGYPTGQPEPVGSGPDRIQFFEHGLVTVVDGVAKRWMPAE